MNSKKVSVIMSVYNEKDTWLKDAIESILEQTWKEFEFIIILDNPNNIEAIKILNYYNEKDSRIRLYINDSNLGLVKSLNKALKLCTGDLIARMDADDYSDPERIEKQVKFLNENLNISLCATGVIIMDESGKEMYKAKIYGKTPNKAKKSLIYRNIFPHGSWMFRKNIIDNIGLYNEIPKAEDYDFLFRIIDKGNDVAVIPEYLFKYRLRESGISYDNLFKQKIVMLKIVEKFKQSKKLKCEYKFDNLICNIDLQKNNYLIYQNLYIEGIQKVRNKDILAGSIKIAKSVINCKYKRKEVIAIIALKYINLLP